jgi:hypothetical protein
VFFKHNPTVSVSAQLAGYQPRTRNTRINGEVTPSRAVGGEEKTVANRRKSATK